MSYEFSNGTIFLLGAPCSGAMWLVKLFEREKLRRLAVELYIADRVSFVGQVKATKSLLSGFDISRLSSDTEQMPNALLEAMAAELTVATVDVGDVRAMVVSENRELVVPRDDLGAFSRAIGRPLPNTGKNGSSLPMKRPSSREACTPSVRDLQASLHISYG